MRTPPTDHAGVGLGAGTTLGRACQGDAMKFWKWTATTGAVAVGAILLVSKKDIQRYLRMHSM